MFVEALRGLAPFLQPECSLHTSSLHWSECVWRKGEAWVPGNPSYTHKVDFMDIREVAVWVHACVCACVVMVSLVHSCATERRSERMSSELHSIFSALCVILCAVVCVGRYRRMQNGKRARIFKQWMVNNLWVQRVWSSWKNLWRELSEATQPSASASTLQEKANPNKLSAIKPNKCSSLRDLSSQTRIPVIKY